VKVENPSRIVCDGCGQAEVDTEVDAAVTGWLVDYSTNPHSHLCPGCQEVARRVGGAAHQASMFGRFFPGRRHHSPLLSSKSVEIQRRESAGSITSSISP
jgi:hypothetical protein